MMLTDELTYSEILTLRGLVDDGPCYDDDTIDHRVVVGRGYAERFSHPDTGHAMLRVTAAGKLRAGGCAR